jgi:NAD(P)H-nitrite reductase large subunit
MSDPKKVQIRDQSFYDALDITFELSSTVKSFDSKTDTVLLEDGTTRAYSHLIVATGSIANRIPVEGHKLGNIFVMRSLLDTGAIDAGKSWSIVTQSLS